MFTVPHGVNNHLMLGYSHRNFARVYGRFGDPVDLVASGGSLLRRRIPGSDFWDLTGCYPVFCCMNWPALKDDIHVLKQENASLVLVADPFLAGGEDYLAQLFDTVRPFKTHYIAELSQPLESFVPKKRILTARKALQRIDVEVSSSPAAWGEDWMALQNQSHHADDASGINVLSIDEINRLLQVPGIVALRATHHGRPVGMHLEFHQGDIVFGHFASYAPDTYSLNVSTALHVCEIEYFSDKARWIDWGGVPGVEDKKNGLSQFKMNFSNTTRTAFLCGSVLNRSVYEHLSASCVDASASYFPAYRAGEHGRSRSSSTI